MRERDRLRKIEEDKLIKQQLKHDRKKRNKLIHDVQELELKKQALKKELSARRHSTKRKYKYQK